MQPGTQVLYYKGRMRESRFLDQRLTPEAHYFGIAEVAAVRDDPASSKRDFFADLTNYLPFPEPIIAKNDERFLEEVPENRVTNYWRDGVRSISKEIFDKITGNSGIAESLSEGQALTSHVRVEGKPIQVYSTRYERDPRLRQQAITIHGLSCKVCGINFEEKYGVIGKGFIHIHHTKPLFLTGETTVNPKTDLVPLCPNCHAMVHWKKELVLTIKQLTQIINGDSI